MKTSSFCFFKYITYKITFFTLLNYLENYISNVQNVIL